MKKFLLAFVFFFISVTEMKIAFGQVYHPFPDTLASWSEGSGGCDFFGDPGSPCTWIGWHYGLYGDTIINSLKYSFVTQQSTYLVNTIVYNFNMQYYYYNFPVTDPGEIIGAIREDSSKKVWFRALNNSFVPPNYPPNGTTFKQDSDELIYDFNLQVGDTLKWKPYFKVVLGIDSVLLLSGEIRKVYRFDNNPVFSDWIEGIGSEMGLFGAYLCETCEFGSGLICFKQDDSLLYENLGWQATSCDETLTGISADVPQNSIAVFPEPAIDYLTFDLINFPNEKFSITIYNSNGQQVNHFGNLHSSQFKIPVSQLGADGMYFYVLKVNNEKLFAGKFLIQR